MTPEASAALDPQLDWAPVWMGLAGGLALFLFGLDQMTAALKTVAGHRLRRWLARLTANRFAGVATGAFTTAVIQSSSVTTVLVVSFISSGVMSLSQSVGVILGANIGTTITAQIVAFKVTKLAFLFVAIGFGLSFASTHETLRRHGEGILGLGIVFLGMTIMSDAMAPLRDYEPFLDAMSRMETPLFGILVSAAFTALVQSSSATTGIVISMATQGLITLPAGIALMLGANVGTCITAMLAAIGKPKEAIRAAVVHVLFNLLGVLVWIGLLDEMAAAVARVSPVFPDLSAADRLAAETPRQIANAHTFFNVANALLFLPFTGLLAAATERLVRDRSLAEDLGTPVRFLDDAFLAAPTIALEQVRQELCHLGTLVLEMLVAILPAMTRGGHTALSRVAAMDAPVDQLYDRIVEYLRKVSQEELSESETEEVLHYMTVANALESIGDLIETDLVWRGRQRLESGVEISTQTTQVISGFHSQVERALRSALRALEESADEPARAVDAEKHRIRRAAKRAALHEADRLTADEGNRLTTYAVEMDMIEDLRRIFYFSRRVAKTVLKLNRTSEDA